MSKNRENNQKLDKETNLKPIGKARTLVEKAKREVPGFAEHYAKFKNKEL